MKHLRKCFFIYFFGLSLVLASSTASMMMQKIKLSSGHDMPVVGLGTWQLSPEDADKSVTAALESGYRHIDTAFLYENEAAIGKSLKKWFDKGGKREDLFITTKLSPVAVRASDVEKNLKLSLERLGLQYVDMYLIHVPFGLLRDTNSFIPVINANGTFAVDHDTDHVATWKAMEVQVKAGRTRSIGLSNFNESQILKVLNHAEIKPSNLQIELQAYNQQKPLRKLCAKYNIAVTGYSTLGSPGSATDMRTEDSVPLPKLLEHPIIKKIAENYNKTTAQVLLRHSVQSGVIVIPKSTNPDRIKQNIDIFDFQLTDDEMKQINGLDRGEDGRIFNFFFVRGIEKHPQYPFASQLEKLEKKSL